MKKTITLLLLLVSTLTFAQVQKLGELSSGKFLDSRIIYEDTTDDVYGYFLLYQKDRISKEEFELEYVLLDKNLNKLTSNSFIAYKAKYAQSQVSLTFVKKIGSDLIIAINDKIIGVRHTFNDRYRKLSLVDFTLSEEVVMVDHKAREKKYKQGESVKYNDVVKNQRVIPTKGDYFLIFGKPEYNPIIAFGEVDEKIETSIKKILVLDKDFNVVKENKINQNKAKRSSYDFYASDQDVFLLQKRKYKGRVIDHIDIYDYKNGFVAEYPLSDTEYKFYVDEACFTENEIVLYVRLFRKKDKYLSSQKALGHAKIVLDKKSGKELKKDYMLWADLAPNIITKGKYGDIKKYGRIFVTDFIHLENGNSILIAEGFKTKKHSEILDLFVIEVDANLQITYFKKVEKNKTVLKGVKATGSYLKGMGAFDYLYSQKLDNDGNLVFFYANNEKEGSRRAKRKNPEWVLGIITYVDGEFNYDKLQLSSKDSQIIPGKAKNGYIRLLEIEEKEIELRLEKINY